MPLSMRRALLVLLCTVGFVWPALQMPVQAQTGSGAEAAGSGPVRIRQPQVPNLDRPASTEPRETTPERSLRDPVNGNRPGATGEADLQPRYRPGEFERYVQRALNDPTFRRFGADLVIDSSASPGERAREDVELPASVPADYKLSAGDEVFVAFWGGVDADLRLLVDRTGRIAIPRVGTVMVAGLTLPEAQAAVTRQAQRVFRNFEVSVTIGQLRSIRVFVTGFAVRPGAHSVSSLATLSSVLLGRAGGPTAAGSFRDIELRRGGRTVAKLDLYDLLLFGRRDADQPLRADDVVHIGPVGDQVALVGSVNKQALFELKPGENVGDLLRMGGGFNAVADRSRVAVERLGDRLLARVRELQLPRDNAAPLGPGDLVRVFSAIDSVLPQERQNKRVRVEGEVNRPGDYVLPPNATIADAVRIAGGLTPAAFVYGTEFTRQSVLQTQIVNYERALRDLELEMAKRGTVTAASARSGEDASSAAASQLANERLLSRLREARPTGRVVLQVAPDAKQLPDLVLEDGDRLTIPATPNSVGVFGSVFNGGSYLFLPQRTVADYLFLAGDPTQGADVDSIFIVRANGSVVSARQKGGSGWFGSARSGFERQPVLPGDTVFVPEELNRTTFLQSAKDWTQILYQFGLGAAAFRTLRN